MPECRASLSGRRRASGTQVFDAPVGRRFGCISCDGSGSRVSWPRRLTGTAVSFLERKGRAVIKKVLQWLGAHPTAAAETPVRRPRPDAWCVVITIDRGKGIEQLKTAPTGDLVEALRTADQFRRSVLYASLVPARLAKDLPQMPAVLTAILPGPMSWVDVLYRRACSN